MIVTAFSKQVLLFDLVTWGTQATPNPAPPTPGGSPTYTFTASPSGSATQFAFSVDNTNGLTLRNLQLQNLPDSSRGQAIASLIEFTGIAVTFGADSALAFDWGAVSTAAFSQASNGQIATEGKSYPYGFKAAYSATMNGCEVTLELSIVLEGPAADFDPLRLLQEVRIYPQIGLTWSYPGGSGPSALRGTVHIVCNTAMATGSGSGNNVASLFSDTNDSTTGAVGVVPTSSNPGPTPRLVPGLGWHLGSFYWPNWSHMFDYCLTNLQTEKQVQAVYDQADAVSGRSGVYPWPPGGSGCAITVTKTPRQGAYDNLHIHGDVGADPLDTAGGAKVFAPACAEACLHVHWRWGPNVDLLGLREYAGWSPDLATSRSFAAPGEPLIPPNQGLRIAITGDSPTFDAQMNLTSSAALPGASKSVWYTADISSPPQGQRQVICEQGVAWAYAYNWMVLFAFTMLTMIGLAATVGLAATLPEELLSGVAEIVASMPPQLETDIANALQGVTLGSFANSPPAYAILDSLFGVLYESIEWMTVTPGGQPVRQVPTGSQLQAGGSSPSMELL